MKTERNIEKHTYEKLGSAGHVAEHFRLNWW